MTFIEKNQVLIFLLLIFSACNYSWKENPVIEYKKLIAEESKIAYTAHYTFWGNIMDDTLDFTNRYYIEELPKDTFIGARLLIIGKQWRWVYDSTSVITFGKDSSIAEKVSLLEFPTGIYSIYGNAVSNGILEDFIVDSFAIKQGVSENELKNDTSLMTFWVTDTVKNINREIKYYFLRGQAFPLKIERRKTTSTDTVYSTVEFSDVTQSFDFEKEKQNVLKGKTIVEKEIKEPTEDDFKLKVSVLPEINGEDVVKGIATTTNSDKKFRLIDFWYMSCPPCKEAIPHLIDFQKKHKDNLQIVGVDYIDKPAMKSNIVQYAKKEGVNYPLVLSNKDSLQSIGVSVFPTMLLIDKKGNILYQHLGWNENALDSIERYIK